MKKYIYKSLVIMIGLTSLSACENNLLNETPISTLSSENSFKTIKDAQTALVGAYSGPAMSNYSGGLKDYFGKLSAINGWGFGGDDIHGWINTANSVFAGYNATALSTDVSSAWSALYATINRTNVIIANTPNLVATQDEKDNIIAEAKALRGFCYMELVQYFGGVPLRLSPPTTVEEALSSPRATEKETWDQIISDFEFAELHLDTKPVSLGRIDKWAAKGLLAKAYLTRACYPVGNYQEPIWFQKAAAKAYEVISQSGKSLNPTTLNSTNAYREYGKMFLASSENTNESLWEFQFAEPDPNGSGLGYFSINGGGKKADVQSPYTYYNMYGATSVSSDFALSFDDNDVRFKWDIGPFTSPGTGRVAADATLWKIYKYRWENAVPGNVYNGAINQIILRLADIYLVYAEASNEATSDPNNTTYGMSAYQAINIVRARAQVPLLNDAYVNAITPFTGTPELLYGMHLSGFVNGVTQPNSGRHVYYKGSSLMERFRDAVLMERGWELCFERQRWFDLKRTGNLINFCQNTHMVTGIKLSNVLTDPINKGSLTITASTKGISQTVIFSSRNIKSYSMYLPIPASEVNINPAIGQANQNPGY